MGTNIDKLLDEADKSLVERTLRKAGGIYRTGSEFENPFYVIVHEYILIQQRELLNQQKAEKVRREIADINQFFYNKIQSVHQT